MKVDKATFGAGCFWHVENAFRKVKGVKDTSVGFMGGHPKNPSYKEVCRGKTGHVEVCQIKFYPKLVSYKKLLDIFWSIHDPTQSDGQGPDIGGQYISVIFFHDKAQLNSAMESREKQQSILKNKIMTKIVPAKKFYEAEEYHQKYLMKNSKLTC